MLLPNLWRKLKATNVIAEFIIVTLSVVAALAGDKYLAHLAILEQEQVALELIHDDLKRDHKHLLSAIEAMSQEDSVIVSLLRHAAGDTSLNDSTVNAAFKDVQHFYYFDRSVASTHNYDSKIKLAGKQILQSDTLSTKLSLYYDGKLNNLALWTEARKEGAFDLSRRINEENGYLDHGVPYVHRIQDKSFSEVLSDLTANIRIMALISDQLWGNELQSEAYESTAEYQHEAIEAIEAYFVENDATFEPFDPQATWSI
jgi:hypothetical protein